MVIVMTYGTHIAGGVCAALLVNTVAPIDNIALVTAVSAFSALIPDIDKADSKLGRKLGPVSSWIEGTFGHRGLFHTPILYVALYFLMSFLLPISFEWITLGFLIGTISHLVLDSFNSKNSGVKWLYPIINKRFSILHIRTRTSGETMFGFVMVFFTIAVVLLSNDIISVNTALSTGFEIPEFGITEYLSNIEMPTFEFPTFEKYEWTIVEDLTSKFEEVEISKLFSW